MARDRVAVDLDEPFVTTLAHGERRRAEALAERGHIGDVEIQARENRLITVQQVLSAQQLEPAVQLQLAHVALNVEPIVWRQ